MDYINGADAGAIEYKFYHVFLWLICILGISFYFYAYLKQSSSTLSMTHLTLSYHMHGVILGNLAIFYYCLYVPMQLPVGLLVDRYGVGKLLLLAAAFCTSGVYLFVNSSVPSVIELGRFLVGFASAFAFTGALKLAAVWLPPQRFAFISGLTLMLGMIGGMTGDVLLISFTSQDSWQSIAYLIACFGLLLLVVMILLVRSNYHAEGSKARKAVLIPNMKQAVLGLLALLKNFQIWLCGMIGILLFLPTTLFAEFWGASYLKAAYNFSDHAAGGAASLIFIGWAIGGPIVGWLSDYLQQRRILLTLGTSLAAIIITAIFYMPALPKAIITPLLFAFGFFSSVQILIFSIGREISPLRSVATMVALLNTMIALSAILQTFIGIMLDAEVFHQAVVKHLPVYNLLDYQIAFLIIPLCLVVAVFLSFFLHETYGKTVDR